jgi:hypothetical protein
VTATVWWWWWGTNDLSGRCGKFSETTRRSTSKQYNLRIIGREKEEESGEGVEEKSVTHPQLQGLLKKKEK